MKASLMLPLALFVTSCSDSVTAEKKISTLPDVEKNAKGGAAPLPAGARLLSKQEISDLLIEATMVGPMITDNAPVRTTFNTNGTYKSGVAGVVYTILTGRYMIRKGRLCQDYDKGGTCSYIAKSAEGTPLLAFPFSGQMQAAGWAPFHVTRGTPRVPQQ